MSAREVVAKYLRSEGIKYDPAGWMTDDILAALTDAGWSVVRLPGPDPRIYVGLPVEVEPHGYRMGHIQGWNACLDEIERLSGGLE